MKKALSLLAVGILLAVAVACSSVESKTKGYLNDLMKAQKAGDVEKVEKIQKEMDEWEATLSEADKEKAAKAALEFMAENMKDLEGMF